MKALPHYQEYFSYVALLLRWLRQGGKPEAETVRNELKKHIQRIERSSHGDPLLKAVYQHVRLPIIFFADHVIAEADGPLAAYWREHRLAYDENELAGDEKFFDIADALIKDPSPEATEALAIIYRCLGLGFTGWYANQADYIHELMESIARRLNLESEGQSRLSAEAYLSLDTRNLIETGRSRMGWMLLSFAAALILALVFSQLIFQQMTRPMREALSDIVSKERFLYPDGEEVAK